MRVWRKANPEKSRASAKAYVKRHPEKVAARQRSYREKNLERAKKLDKVRYEANKEKWYEWNKARALANPEKTAEYHRVYNQKRRMNMTEDQRRQEAIYQHEWRVRNRASSKAAHEKRKAALPKDRLSPVAFRLVVKMQSGLCFDCKQEKKLTIGHLLPVSKGGGNGVCNIVAQCRSCNSKQHNHPHPFLEVMRKESVFSESMVRA